MTLERLMAIGKEEMDAAAHALGKGDVADLIPWLNETNEPIRYNAFLLLKSRSRIADDVYPYWDEFEAKLKSENSFFRSIGVILMAANARWDSAGRFDGFLDAYLDFLDDEKPMVVRLCIQSMADVVPYKPGLCAKIAEKLMSIDLSQRKDTQQKLLLKDILGILAMIRKTTPVESIGDYFAGAFASGRLSRKEIGEIQALLA
jgi:hypothetical protein